MATVLSFFVLQADDLTAVISSDQMVPYKLHMVMVGRKNFHLTWLRVTWSIRSQSSHRPFPPGSPPSAFLWGRIFSADVATSWMSCNAVAAVAQRTSNTGGISPAFLHASRSSAFTELEQSSSLAFLFVFGCRWRRLTSCFPCVFLTRDVNQASALSLLLLFHSSLFFGLSSCSVVVGSSRPRPEFLQLWHHLEAGRETWPHCMESEF